ncbi:MAG: DNA primase [Cyanobacteriota bacterium]|nr:DNA primase [Cyanobacteriota bacterium]
MSHPRLHPDTIEEVKQRADIHDVVSEHVVLRKQGREFVGLCPFHEEKTPSFHVNPTKQMYYCFGCAKGGNAITFLKEIGQQSFTEVVLGLAQRYQVSVKTLAPEQRQELQRQLSLREQLYEIMAVAVSFFEHALRQPQGKIALDYLKNQRQLSEATLQQFQLGYAPEGWETLYGYLVRQKHYPVELVEKAGLIVPRQSGSGYYDRFRHRLMIPIRDAQGRAIGFGGRTLTDEQPKYLNSPETELFDKGKTLFGLDRARTAISKDDRAVVVEGYFDAIALQAAGIENVVASLGTALSSYQVKQLLRYTESKQIILNFDADAAGIRAAERAIGEIETLAYQGDVQLRILNIPEGKDADDFLKSASADRYRELVENAPLWLDWQIDGIVGKGDLKQADRYHQAAQEMVKLLSKIGNGNTRTYYTNKCAEQLSQGDSRLVPLLVENLVARIRKRRSNTDRDRASSNSVTPLPMGADRTSIERAEALLLRIYLHCQSHRTTLLQEIQTLEENEISFSISTHQILWEKLLEVEQTLTLEPIELISQIQEQLEDAAIERDRLSSILHLDEKLEQDILRTPLTIRAAIACLEKAVRQARYRHFIQLWTKTDCAEEPELARQYQEQLYAEKARISELDRQRFPSFEELIRHPVDS